METEKYFQWSMVRDKSSEIFWFLGECAYVLIHENVFISFRIVVDARDFKIFGYCDVTHDALKHAAP